MDLQIYELADVATVLEMEKSRAKNWTIGRPFSVRPSVRAAFGKGSRNLFSKNDLYCFALLKHLSEVGVPVEALQKMLEELRSDLTEDSFWRRKDWLIISRFGLESSYNIGVHAGSDTVFTSFAGPKDEIVCSYAANLKFIVYYVSERVAALAPQQIASAKRGKKKRFRRYCGKCVFLSSAVTRTVNSFGGKAKSRHTQD